MSTQDERYLAAFIRCEKACRAWQAANPEARPKFRPLRLPPAPGRGRWIGTIDAALMAGVAGNSVARKLLTVMDRAVADGGGGTIMMAEYALEQVYGIKSALTQQTAN